MALFIAAVTPSCVPTAHANRCRVVDSDEDSQPDDDEISNAEVEVADLIESSEDEAATPLPSAGRRGTAAAKRNTQGTH